MNKFYFAIICCITLLSCNQPRTDKDKDRIDAVCDKFMQVFKDGKIPDAIQLLKINSVLDSSTIDTLQKQITEQIKGNTFSSYGEIQSYEFVSEHKIKDFIARRFYILKFKKYYLKFNFTLYNNGTGWKITEFLYNDELIELLY